MYEFVELSLEEFDNFSMQYHQPAFVQSAAIAKVQQKQNKQYACYGVLKNNELIGAGLYIIRPVISKYTIAHCNQGPLIPFDNRELLKFYFDNVQNALKKHHCLHCILTPNFELKERNQDGEIVENGFDHSDYVDNLKAIGLEHEGFDNSLINGVGRWMFYKDVSQIETEKELKASLNQSARTIFNRISKMPFEIRDLDIDELEDFNQIMENTAERRQFQDRGPKYYQSLKQEFKNNLKILVAYLDFSEYLKDLQKQETELLKKQQQLLNKAETKKIKGQLSELNNVLVSVQKRINKVEALNPKAELIPLAGSMFVRHGNELTYFLSGAYDQYFDFDAPYALQKEALKLCMNSEIKNYNFYGTNGKFNGYEDEGVYIFKKGFGGRVIEQPGNFRLVVNSMMDKLYNLSRIIRK